MPGHENKGAMSDREMDMLTERKVDFIDRLPSDMKRSVINMKGAMSDKELDMLEQKMGMQENAFNPMPTTSQSEIFRMNPGMQAEMDRILKESVARKRADLAFLGIDDSMMSDTEVSNYIIPPELQELLNQQPPPPEMREQGFKTDRMIADMASQTEGLTELLDPNMMGALGTFQAGK